MPKEISKLLLQAKNWAKVFYFALSLLLPSQWGLMKKIKGAVSQMWKLHFLHALELESK